MTTMFLVGRHIEHSLSPAMWNHLFAATRMEVSYGRRDVDEDGLADVESELRSPGVLAANVTMPHKAWAASLAERRSDVVARLGVANLLIPSSDGVAAHNTDVTGAREVLAGRSPYRRVTILGAGGTARAMLEALRGLSDDVTVSNRSADRAALVVDEFQDVFPRIEAVEWDARGRSVAASDLVVSTVPFVDELPVDIADLTGSMLYDVVYRSRPTAMQVAAREAGIPTSDGLVHLHAQAAAMLPILGFDPGWASLLGEGLARGCGRSPRAWAGPPENPHPT